MKKIPFNIFKNRLSRYIPCSNREKFRVVSNYLKELGFAPEDEENMQLGEVNCWTIQISKSGRMVAGDFQDLGFEDVMTFDELLKEVSEQISAVVNIGSHSEPLMVDIHKECKVIDIGQGKIEEKLIPFYVIEGLHKAIRGLGAGRARLDFVSVCGWYLTEEHIATLYNHIVSL